MAIKKITKKLKPYQIWKTIKLGTGFKDGDGFYKALKRAGFKISPWAQDILKAPSFKVNKLEIDVELIKITAGELGFKKGTTLKEGYKRAKTKGFELCPCEVGPQLRLQYPDQPKGEYIKVAMKPIADGKGNKLIFGIDHGISDGKWLGTSHGELDYGWRAEEPVVFLRRKT